MAATTKSLTKHHNITTTTKSLPRYQSARQQEQNLWNSLPKDLPKGTMTAQCRPFKCIKDESTCDNIHPTNYDGPIHHAVHTYYETWYKYSMKRCQL